MNPIEVAFREPQKFQLTGAIRESHRMTCARPSNSGKLPAFKPMELSADQFETWGPTAIWRWRETPSGPVPHAVPTFSAVKGVFAAVVPRKTVNRQPDDGRFGDVAAELCANEALLPDGSRGAPPQG